MAVLRCFALSVVLSFLLSCPSFAQDNLKKVTFVPLWKPQAQFAGYYAALEKGIYKKHGLDVAILQEARIFLRPRLSRMARPISV